MTRQNNKTCLVCGKVYTFCPNCREFANQPLWLNIYHDENCKKIFETVRDYLAGSLSEADAKEKLKTLDLSNIKNFETNIKFTIEKLLGKTTKETKESTSEDKESSSKKKSYTEDVQ